MRKAKANINKEYTYGEKDLFKLTDNITDLLDANIDLSATVDFSIVENVDYDVETIDDQ